MHTIQQQICYYSNRCVSLWSKNMQLKHRGNKYDRHKTTAYHLTHAPSCHEILNYKVCFISLSVTEITQLAILFTPGSERMLKKSSYSAKFKNQLVQLNNFSSAHHIVLSIEDRVDVHSWLKPPHKCTANHPNMLTTSIYTY